MDLVVGFILVVAHGAGELGACLCLSHANRFSSALRLRSLRLCGEARRRTFLKHKVAEFSEKVFGD